MAINKQRLEKIKARPQGRRDLDLHFVFFCFCFFFFFPVTGLFLGFLGFSKMVVDSVQV